jgi:hypothetical protein
LYIFFFWGGGGKNTSVFGIQVSYTKTNARASINEIYKRHEKKRVYKRNIQTPQKKACL